MRARRPACPLVCSTGWDMPGEWSPFASTRACNFASDSFPCSVDSLRAGILAMTIRNLRPAGWICVHWYSYGKIGPRKLWIFLFFFFFFARWFSLETSLCGKILVCMSLASHFEIFVNVGARDDHSHHGWIWKQYKKCMLQDISCENIFSKI